MATLEELKKRFQEGDLGTLPHMNRREEAELREQHPGLKELWEQYQAVLKLVAPAEPKEDSEYFEADNTAADILNMIQARREGK